MAELNNEISDTQQTARGWGRLLSLLNIRSSKPSPAIKAYETRTDQQPMIGQFTLGELHNLPGISKNIEDTPQQNTSMLMGHLVDTSNQSRLTIQETSTLKFMTPEISQAATIFTSSVMSPNDMQTDAVPISFTIGNVTEDTNKRVTELLHNFFNDELDLGIKAAKWIKAAAFETGVCPIVVLPRSNLQVLNAALDKERSGLGQQTSTSMIASMEGYSSATYLSPTKNKQQLEILTHRVSTAIMSVESWDALDVPKRLSASKALTADTLQLLKNNSSSIVFTSNPAGLSNTDTALKTNVESVTAQISRQFMGEQNNNYIFLVSANPKIGDNDQPALVELPPENVVPVCVPGTTAEHIGYFVLLDQWDSPIGMVTSPSTYPGSSQLATNSMMTMYGSMTSNPIIKSMNNMQKFQAATVAFGVTLKNMLENHLDAMGFKGLDVKHNEAVSNCLFNHLLNKKQVKLLFIPEPLMVYYAFDFRSDGTGKTRIEDVAMLLSLRTTLMVAYIMGAVKNAQDNKTIEIELDKKDTNIEQTMNMLRTLYVEKRGMRFNNNPAAVANGITQMGLTINAKGIKGLENFNVTTDTKPNNSVMPDDTLMEKLTDMAISGMGVPHSALNALGEAEYAKSVTSSNLYFSNNIRCAQRIAIKLHDKLVRNYVRYSRPIQKRVYEILQADPYYAQNVPATITAGTEADAVVNDTEDTAAVAQAPVITESKLPTVEQIISCIKTTLPSTNIAIDKARFEEIRSYNELVDMLLESVMPDDMVTDMDLKDVFKSAKANIKSTTMKRFLKDIGHHGITELEDVSELDSTQQKALHLVLRNIKAGLDGQKTALAPGDTDSMSGGDMGGGSEPTGMDEGPGGLGSGGFKF